MTTYTHSNGDRTAEIDFRGFKLDPDLKAQWLEALRSGKYSHGTKSLRNPPCLDYRTETFCCLGVLADVINPNGWVDASISGSRWRLSEESIVSTAYLPGIDDKLPDDVQWDLAAINDAEETYDLVIRVIEENL